MHSNNKIKGKRIIREIIELGGDGEIIGGREGRNHEGLNNRG